MSVSIRRLGQGDEAILSLLATEDADFEVAGRGEPLQPLSADAARHYLDNPAVLHWVATEAETIAGYLYCVLLPLRSGEGRELLLYEIGVRNAWRRRCIGRALLDQMENWMQLNGVGEVWVLADNPEAVSFYHACGFSADDSMAVYMSRQRNSKDV